MSILIVEDNPNMRRMLAELVQNKFDRIYEGSDGDEAFALYERHLPDWVLMDWEMPRVDGITAMREIISRHPSANICMVTAFDDAELRGAAFAAGAVGFISKRNLAELGSILLDR